MPKDWDAIQHILKNQLKPGIFQAWIRPLVGNIQGSDLILEAPNPFVAGWIRQHMLEDILTAVRQVLGSQTSVQITAKKGTRGQSSRRHEPNEPLTLPMDPAIKTAEMAFNADFRFEDFVVGPSNEMAYMAAHHFSSRNFASDQLFLCAPTGLGKTHLIHAIGHSVIKASNRSRLRVACLSAEDFANQMIMSLKAREIERFKARYREQVDVLLLEDIHFFQGKEKIQDELICTLNALAQHGSKVVFTSTFFPKELKAVNPHLASRLSQGFMAEIAPPDFETRRKIVACKAKKFQIALPEGIQNILAEHLNHDVRQLESCIKNLALKVKLLNRPADRDMLVDVLSHYETSNTILDLPRIVDFVCKTYSLSPQELKSKSRKRHLVLARNTVFLLARQHTGLSLNEIGASLNRRHSTVLKGIANLEKAIKDDTRFGQEVQRTIGHLLAPDPKGHVPTLRSP
ncbi:MAG: chromosomal replication initiator protein DnaA [Deltaproteobacteria bacterium]|nr:chromosomal replication initiator protein DnaA [Deltaproteobacteria bacterium]